MRYGVYEIMFLLNLRVNECLIFFLGGKERICIKRLLWGFFGIIVRVLDDEFKIWVMNKS